MHLFDVRVDQRFHQIVHVLQDEVNILGRLLQLQLVDEVRQRPENQLQDLLRLAAAVTQVRQGYHRVLPDHLRVLVLHVAYYVLDAAVYVRVELLLHPDYHLAQGVRRCHLLLDRVGVQRHRLLAPEHLQIERLLNHLLVLYVII